MTEVTVTQSARDAAKALLDKLALRFHQDGTFRDWDNTVQAFAAAETRGYEAAKKQAAEVARGQYAGHGATLGTVRAFAYENAGRWIATAIEAMEPSHDK